MTAFYFEPHLIQFIISQKYYSPHIKWIQQLPDIPSHVGEPVYPGIPLVSLPKKNPESVPNFKFNNLPNSVPNSVPIPVNSLNNVRNDKQVNVPKGQHVDASTNVRIIQKAVNR